METKDRLVQIELSTDELVELFAVELDENDEEYKKQLFLVIQFGEYLKYSKAVSLFPNIFMNGKLMTDGFRKLIRAVKKDGYLYEVKCFLVGSFLDHCCSQKMQPIDEYQSITVEDYFKLNRTKDS